MDKFTTNTYEMKRDIVNFSKKICKNVSKRQTKFVTEMIYGISKSKDILLSSIADSLNENTKKAYVIDRLSDNLSLDLDTSINENYNNLVMDSLGQNPVFLVDDSDIIKPLGQKFEDLGIVRDGSSRNKAYEKGYHHTEIVGITEKMKQPISIFSKIHSSISKDYVSNNTVTFEGLDKVIDLLKERKLTGTFVNDRGYDNNAIFNYYFDKKQYFIIRLKENRKIYRKHKWYPITTFRDAFNGKINMKLMFQGEEKECKVSVIKAHVIRVTRNYLNRWRIEEYFKFKKQEYNFENFRVRNLKSINNLNKLLTYAIGIVALLSEKIGRRQFIQKIIKESKSLKENVCLWLYQIARGIFNILMMAKTGIKEWENIRKMKQYENQISLF